MDGGERSTKREMRVEGALSASYALSALTWRRKGGGAYHTSLSVCKVQTACHSCADNLLNPKPNSPAPIYMDKIHEGIEYRIHKQVTQTTRYTEIWRVRKGQDEEYGGRKMYHQRIAQIQKG